MLNYHNCLRLHETSAGDKMRMREKLVGEGEKCLAKENEELNLKVVSTQNDLNETRFQETETKE